MRSCPFPSSREAQVLNQRPPPSHYRRPRNSFLSPPFVLRARCVFRLSKRGLVIRAPSRCTHRLLHLPSRSGSPSSLESEIKVLFALSLHFRRKRNCHCAKLYVGGTDLHGPTFWAQPSSPSIFTSGEAVRSMTCDSPSSTY